jgi:hypothetical protein
VALLLFLTDQQAALYLALASMLGTLHILHDAAAHVGNPNMYVYMSVG